MIRADPVECVPLYDTHVHLFTSDWQRYPVNTANAREGEDNLRRRILSEPLTPERVLEHWDDSGVTAGVGVQFHSVYKKDNRYILDVAERYPQRIVPVVMLDAAAPGTPAMLSKYVAERGVVGLRLYGRAEADGSHPWLNSRAALETWKVAERHALTMVLMYVPRQSAPSACEAIAALAERFPSTRIALDHFGWSGSEPEEFGLNPALLRLREYRNVHYKLSTINFHTFERAGIDSTKFVRHAVDVFGADRMMWGSDVGNTQESYVSMAHRARASAALLTPAERRQFLHDTGARVHARSGVSPQPLLRLSDNKM